MPLVRRAMDVLLVLIVVGSVGIAAASALAPGAGLRLFAIRSASMEPALPIGSMVAVSTRNASVGPDDVVTLSLPSGLHVTHRVVWVDENGDFVQTKGDANESPDPVAIPSSMVVGRVVAVVPFLGFLLAMTSMPIGVVALIALGGTLLTAAWLLDEIEHDDRDQESGDVLDESNPGRRVELTT